MQAKVNRLVLILALGMLGCAAQRPIPVPVPDAPSHPITLPNAVMGKPYKTQLLGGKLKQGKLPGGMILNSSGQLSGIPVAIGTYTFTVTQ